jgi:glycerophosphoryl diester phosphodiesterase
MNVANVVAHRGYSARYPENTRLSLEQAIAAGAKYIELDVQLSSDGVPIIIHDDNLQRTSGLNASVLESLWVDLQTVCVGEVDRLGEVHAYESLSPLAVLVDILNAHPEVHAFVELKEESLNHFGRAEMLQQVMTVIAPVYSQCSIISFDAEVLPLVRRDYGGQIGWVISRWSDEQRAIAEQIKPEILICNYSKIDTPLWPGNWQWFLYEIIEAELALQWVDKGVKYIEGMELQELLACPRLHGG